MYRHNFSNFSLSCASATMQQPSGNPISMAAFIKNRFALLILAPLVAAAADTSAETAPATTMIPASYADPGTLVDVGNGRTLNLRCSGSGEPVVMLEAGGNADSSTWYRVQDPLAQQTRVCSYDRAGFGFSVEGPMPRNLDALVADLQTLIGAAKLATPLVLVGHSLGSNIVRRFVQRHPGQVAGMVLVDPPEHSADARMPADWQQQVAAMVAQRGAILDRCEAAATKGDRETLTQACLRAPPPWMGTDVAVANTANKGKPSYWRTLRSELASSVDIYAAPVPEGESYGAIPLLLLTAPGDPGDVPEAVREATAVALRETQERLLAASTRSTHVVVADSSHDIQLDKPEAVVTAVTQLLEGQSGKDQ